jgi:uncharacterized protein YbaR (Trm112 family)
MRDGAASGWLHRITGDLHMSISKELLDILACPKCKGDIHLNQNNDGLICDSCRLMYPIKDDIPVMLIDEAIRL